MNGGGGGGIYKTDDMSENNLKPIINKYSSQNGGGDVIKNGISSWESIKNDILRVLGVPIPLPPKPVPVPVPVLVPVLNTGTATTGVTIGASIGTGTSSHSRGPAPIVLAALNKTQTIQQLRRLKGKLNSGQHYRTKADKKKIYTTINNIEKDIVIDDDIMNDKIDNLIEMLLGLDKTENEKIKNAAALQDL